MATITTRYSVGNTVYSASACVKKHRIQCPDCLGTRKWSASLPNGEIVDIECPTCKCGYLTMGTIEEYKVTGVIQELTVGQVEYDRDGPRYMCQETGVGSGTVWRESDLHPSQEEAEAALPDLIAKQEEHQRDYALNLYLNKKKGKHDRIGAMTAYYRKEIRDAKKRLKDAENSLKRISGERS